MSLTNFSDSVVWIPNMLNNHTSSQTRIEQIETQLQTVATKLQSIGVKYTFMIGCMGLDYNGYDLSSYLPHLLLLHSTVQDISMAPLTYEDLDMEQLIADINFVNNQVVFLPDLIYREAYNRAVASMSQYQTLLNPECADIEVECPQLEKYYGEELLKWWLLQSKILVIFDYQKHTKYFKNIFKSHKAGIKINITPTSIEYWLCGNPVRDSYLFNA